MAKKVNNSSTCNQKVISKGAPIINENSIKAIIDLKKIAEDAPLKKEDKVNLDVVSRAYKFRVCQTLESQRGILIKSRKKHKYFAIKNLNEATKLLTNHNYWECADSYVFALTMIKYISDYIVITDLKDYYRIKITSDEYLLYIKDRKVPVEKQIQLMSLFLEYFTGGITCLININNLKDKQDAMDLAKANGIKKVLFNVINGD